MNENDQEQDEPFGLNDLADLIIRYEDEGLTREEEDRFFQLLIDNPRILAGLQGSYQRTAAHMIKAGRCHPRGARS